MAVHKQLQHPPHVEETEEEKALSTPKVDSDKLKHDIDDILDEIDEVLENNAEEFVKSYVQKGGQ